jgi:hypothetical protein
MGNQLLELTVILYKLVQPVQLRDPHASKLLLPCGKYGLRNTNLAAEILARVPLKALVRARAICPSADLERFIADQLMRRVSIKVSRF